MLIRAMNGSQTFKKTSAKVHLFAMDCNDTYDRVFLNVRGTSVGRPTKLSAANNDTDSNGYWYSNSIDLPDDTVISISSSVSKNGSIYSEGVLLISLRKDAPLISISVDVNSPKKGARFKSVNAFNGRGYILKREEFSAFNISYPRGMICRFFDKEEIKELYTIKELQKGVTRPKMVKVETSNGKSKMVRLPKGKRRRVVIE